MFFYHHKTAFKNKISTCGNFRRKNDLIRTQFFIKEFFIFLFYDNINLL